MVTLHRDLASCKGLFLMEQSGQGPFCLFNLSTEWDSLYLALSWCRLPYDKKVNDEVLFLYQQLTAAGHHGVRGTPALLHAEMEYK